MSGNLKESTESLSIASNTTTTTTATTTTTTTTSASTTTTSSSTSASAAAATSSSSTTPPPPPPPLPPPPPQQQQPITLKASEIDVDFLPLLHDIIRTVEKDNQDVSQKNKDSLEVSQKVLELAGKIDSIRDKVYKLPGIACSKEQQLDNVKILSKQLQLKKDLINKYKGINLKVSGLGGV